MRVLIDANVLADALLDSDERPQGDRANAIRILDACVTRDVTGVITAPLFTFLVHAVKPRKVEHRVEMEEALEYLLDILEWATVSPEHCRTALASSFKDLEDGIQFFATRPEAIVTRDGKDYREHVHVPVYTAAEFVAKHLK